MPKHSLAQRSLPLEKPLGRATPHPLSIAKLRREAAECTRCPLYANATQTVFGAGPAAARVVMVGEQPGNDEDRSGAPFVGPAGRVLDGLLEEAEIDRALVYVTNAVKHFKWVPRGKRRIHSKPTHGEVDACRFWLDQEMTAVRPRVIVALGATAAYAMMGPNFRLTPNLGKALASPWSQYWIGTYHPSMLLRSQEPQARARLRALVLGHLRHAWELASA